MIEVVGTGRLLSLQDRLVIADGLINRESMRSIAARLGRPGRVRWSV
ncbi:helix-turn-helix domain-containing protein [Janibacter sp. FSL W8-0316]